MDLSQTIWSRCLEYAAVSDVGQRRANNQDSYAAILAGDQTDFEQRGHFFMVADGMGAHAAGELASKMAADVVSLVYRKRTDQAPPEAVLAAILNANHQIHTRGLASLDFRGMGTTATALVLLPAGAIVAHVGDSRAYQLRGTCLEQLTFDHSLVWEVRAAGQMQNAELPNYISKNIITRSLGPNAAVQVDLEGPYPVQPGDAFLLCSDGLSNQVSDEEIGLILGSLPAAEAAQALVDLANLRGGPDNITVVVARAFGPQIAQNTDADPSYRAASKNLRPVHAGVWTLMGVAALGAAGLLALGYSVAALLAFLAAAAALVVAMAHRYGAPDHHAQIAKRRFGRGPYVTCQCVPSADLLARLASDAQQVREATDEENRPVDWATFEGFLAQAVAAVQAGNLADAARAYLRAIMHVMAQIRQIHKAASDSGAIPL